MSDFEQELRRALDRHLSGAPPNLRAAIEYSALAPGKRIRPRLLLATAHLLQTPGPASAAAAIALELIHCFTLIHDDLPCMDNDDFRRGRPSNHKVHGEALALLAGDAIIPLAFEILLEALPPSVVAETFRVLSRHSGPRGVIGGQAAEMLLSSKSTLDELRAMHAAKTGALFEASIDLARAMSGRSSDDPDSKILIRFARAIGLAFQTADDLDDAGRDPDPISILSYLGPRAAIEQAVDPLTSSEEEITARWPDPSLHGPLLAISAEVHNTLRGFGSS